MGTKTALILGATGGIGGAMRERLLAGGWCVKTLTRRPSPLLDGCEHILGDALDAEAVLHAAQGADAIVHAVNPPGYRNWATLVLPMIDNTIHAAEVVGARIVLPGTV
jgi:uncharacterized protein YbjT (DUF2867 family)